MTVFAEDQSEPSVWTAPLLTSGLFVLAALFVGAAIATLALARLAHVAFMILLAALLTGRLVILLIATGSLLTARLIVLATLLPEILISIVCHIYSSPKVRD